MKVEDGLTLKTCAEFDSEDLRRVHLNRKAILMLWAGLNEDDFFKVCTLPSVKHMSDTLEIAYEGTEAVKESRGQHAYH